MDTVAGIAGSLFNKVIGIVPPQAALLGVLQLLGGKFIKKYTTEDVPNEIALVWSMAIAMFGYMLIGTGAHPDWSFQMLSEASLWPAMKQFVVVTGIHSVTKNGGKLAQLGTLALKAATAVIPGGSIIGKILGFFVKK